MAPGKTFLFGDSRIATASSGHSTYQHTFGGPHDRRGASRKECQGILIHLLHRLDLSDPAVPLSIPGRRWLPFYYCFDFRANDLGYRLLSDDAMEAYFPTDDPNVTNEESWPDDDYPLEFPRSNITVAAFDYDPTKLDDAYRWAGVYGIGRLSTRDQTAARNRVAKLVTGLGFRAPETTKEFDEALCSPYSQGKPNAPCLNPRCPNHQKKGALVPLALMPAEPVAGVHTFGRYGGGVQLIFHICPECHTIRVSNQCD